MQSAGIDQLVEAVLAYDRIQKTRDYVARGRRFSPLTAEALGQAWVSAVTAVAFGDDDWVDEWSDLGAELDLRGLARPEHLIPAQVMAALRDRVAQSTPEHFEAVAKHVRRVRQDLNQQRRH